MALQIISSNMGDRQGTVTIQGDTQEEVMSLTAKQEVLRFAARYISRPGLSGNEVAYPVDAQGQSSDDLILGRPGTQVAAYRCDYNVTGGL